MLKEANLNILDWDKLTPARQSMYIQWYYTKLGGNEADTKTPEEMFAPQNDVVVSSG